MPNSSNPGLSIQALSSAIKASYTIVAEGCPIEFQADVEGRTIASRWDFGDGTAISNQVYVSHIWKTAGDYLVKLRAFNESFPTGVPANLIVHVLKQPVLYAAQYGQNPVAPFNSWATAATNIQAAIDAATMPGALVLVSNGVYSTGVRAVHGVSNRVAVTKPVVVQSLNGPGVTLIQGYRGPGTTNGPAAIRCAYLTNGAVLAGFTLTNGATQGSGGGVWCESIGAVVSNCVLTANSASSDGGGACCGTLLACVLSGNSAYSGGGSIYGTLSNCILRGNTASSGGGGACCGTLNNCTLTGNSASSGGGALAATLNASTLADNTASSGGGSGLCTLNNCTLTGNLAYSTGGGSDSSTLNNCIVYYNKAPDGNYSLDCSLNYCCTTPLPGGGAGNLSDDPQLASASHLSASSPCLASGSAAYSTGLDIDGEPWASPPSIGCDEYIGSSLTGTLVVAIGTSDTNTTTSFDMGFQAIITGPARASTWDFGDGTVTSNRPYASHAWAEPGDYTVILTAYNASYPAGVSARKTVHVITQPVYYVVFSSFAPTPPFNSWATAATNIQDAIDAATVPGALVLVSNGVYATGARAVYGMSNRVAVTKPIVVRSLNGPAVTFIQGYRDPGTINGPAAIRCAYLTNGAMLVGFTLTNGATQSSGDYQRQQSGGGVCCEPVGAEVSNCMLMGNSAYSGGGGACYGILTNCALEDNSAGHGGGTYYGILNNCSLTGNSADDGGGADNGILNNCVLTSNLAIGGGGGASESILNNCVLIDNSAEQGGGACLGMLNNCVLTDNSANYSGGGSFLDIINNCTLMGNSAEEEGGGAEEGTLCNCILLENWVDATDGFGGGAGLSTLNNCVLNGNWAATGGGVSDSILTNCILEGNTAKLGGGASDSSSDYIGYTQLAHCTLSGNAATLGGGANRAVLIACILRGNSASIGGAACGSVLTNCLLEGNSASLGGAACSNSLYSCTLVGNSALQSGGATISSALFNSIVYYNRAPDGNCDSNSILNYCCVMPLPTKGVGNFTNPPMFDGKNSAPYAVAPNSPCINAGRNLYVAASTDLEGNPRVVGGTVDIGAYEFQNPVSSISYIWLQQHGLTISPGVDLADPDGDGFNNWQEWQAGTDPTNAASALRMFPPLMSNATVYLRWISVTNRTYALERTVSLVSNRGSWLSIGSKISGISPSTTAIDSNSLSGPFFYRVRVESVRN